MYNGDTIGIQTASEDRDIGIGTRPLYYACDANSTVKHNARNEFDANQKRQTPLYRDMESLLMYGLVLWLVKRY